MGINSWNSTDIASNRTRIHAKWVNYLDSNGDWSPIDCILTQDIMGFHITNAPFEFHAPLLSDGLATFNVNNRYDVFNKSEITADPFSQTIKALGVITVSGELYDINGDGRLDAVKYPNAYGVGIHLVYYVKHGEAPRLEKLIQFDNALAVNTDYEFEITYSDKTEISPRKLPDNTTRLEHRDNSSNILNTPAPLSHDEGFYIRKWNEPQKRGIGIKTPTIWDSGTYEDFKSQVIDVDIRKGAGLNKYILTKHIKTSFFSGVTYPVFTDTTSTFYPDPDPATTAGDGIVYYEGGATWAIAHDALNGTGATNNGVNLLCYSTLVGTYRIYRAVVSFDTSVIGASTVNSATLNLYVNAKNDFDNDGNDFITVVEATPASDTALVVGDYDAVGDAITNPTEGSNRREVTSGITLSAYNVWTLDSTGISWIDSAGVTNLGVREGHDVVNDPVTGSYTGIVFASADTAGTSQDPYLEVVHVSGVILVTGTATATDGGNRDINVSMPYTDDSNNNSTYTIDYKLSADSVYTNWVTNAPNTPSPYTDTITGLVNAGIYDVQVTYNDSDGVTGTNPQTITNIQLSALPEKFIPKLLRHGKPFKVVKNDGITKVIKRINISKVIK